MVLTLEKLFNDAAIVRAIIDRIEQMKLDTIYWKRYLDFEQTASRTFKTYLGTITGVTAGSVIDRNSNKPLRERRNVGSGFGEIAYLGDRYQFDNDRLDMLRVLISKFNEAKAADQTAAMNDIVDYIVDDFRQCLLAPHKRMDLVVGDLRSVGKASVKVADNPFGVELVDIELPMHFLTPKAAVKAKFISYMKETVEKLRAQFGAFSVMEMTRATLNKYIIGAEEFGDKFTMIFGYGELAKSGGLMTEGMTNQLLSGIGLPNVRVIEDYVALPDGTNKLAFAEDRITLLTQDKVGKMRWHEPYEISDPVPGKTYTRHEGGMYISQVRTDEGRFMEYGAEWIPEFKWPHKMVNIDLKNLV